jgi:hypothetical protein
MQTDGQTDMTKLTIAFRNFANAPKLKIHNYTVIFKPYFTENPLNFHYKDYYICNKPSNALLGQIYQSNVLLLHVSMCVHHLQGAFVFC